MDGHDADAAEGVAVSIVAEDVHVTYRVQEDNQRPTLRRLMGRNFKSGTARTVHAVRGVSLVARDGESIGLIGRNGSGKSTLLRAMSGLQPMESGAVYARSNPVLLGVGAALHPELSGRRNVFLGGTAMGLSKAELAERFDDIVDFAGVRGHIDMPLRTYSSGMQARLQFALASAITPDILMIDEALAVGDEEFRQRSQARIAALLETASTVVVVSHSMSSILDMCSRVVWMQEGVVVQDGPAAEVVAEYRRSTTAVPSA